MDCHATTGLEPVEGRSMNRLVIVKVAVIAKVAVIVKVAVIANAVKQSMTSEGMDRHGLQPRDDANNTVIARNVVTWQSVCSIGPDSGGVP
jgi:hypothetical protein